MVGDVLAERYELEEVVGSGGMSTVYRAHDSVLDRTVALKVLHQRLTSEQEYVERFRREARMVAGLVHHNIVTVIDRGEDGGCPFIVFEFVAGENLKQLVDRTGPLPVERALELAIQVAHGLSFAHINGYVHRDVKPQNVLLKGDGEAKVTDFGIARSLIVEHGVTQTGTVLGTSDYIAPEQAQGHQVDEHTDTYSLGVVLYELLTGELPFSGDNFVAIAMKHINEPPPHVSALRRDVPPRLDAAVARALAKRPEDRFATMADFAAELDACLAELRSPGASETMVIPPPKRMRPAKRRLPGRRSRPAASIVVVTIGLAIGVVVLAVVLIREIGSSGTPSTGGSGVAIPLTGVGDYPAGASDTHANTASRATDGSSGTYWYTQTYDSPDFGGLMHGLGLLLDAGTTVKLARITVTTTTPGFVAQILAGDSRSSLSPDSATQTVGPTATFTLDGATARYYSVFITQLPPGRKAEIEEATATS